MAGRMIQVSVKPSYENIVFALMIDDELPYVQTTHFIQAQALEHLRRHVEIGMLNVREFPPPSIDEVTDDDLSIP